MGSSLDMFKTLIVPALISLSIWLLFSYLIIPFFRRYRQRYAQYLPLNRISAHTLPIRERIADALMHFFLPSSWSRFPRFASGGMVAVPEEDDHNRPDNNDSISIFDEEGENMAEMNISSARREALESRRSLNVSQARLSRDLEEGFMDDSDDEDDHGR